MKLANEFTFADDDRLVLTWIANGVNRVIISRSSIIVEERRYDALGQERWIFVPWDTLNVDGKTSITMLLMEELFSRNEELNRVYGLWETANRRAEKYRRRARKLEKILEADEVQP